jgi:hypothetical protein
MFDAQRSEGEELSTGNRSHDTVNSNNSWLFVTVLGHQGGSLLETTMGIEVVRSDRSQKELQGVFRVNGVKKTPLATGNADPANNTTARATAFRPRRTHRKSRLGCKNCKVRKLKCDESRSFNGGCERCNSHGVECDYLHVKPRRPVREITDGSVEVATASPIDASLDTLEDDLCLTGANIETSTTLTRLSSPNTLHFRWLPEELSAGVLNEDVMSPLAMLGHFARTTALTVGNTKSQRVAQSRVVAAAVQTPYLLNSILGLAAAHLRYLMPDALPDMKAKLRVAEYSYWAQAFAAFQRELAGSESLRIADPAACRGNVNKNNMDQLLSTVMFVAMHQFSQRDDYGVDSAYKSFVWLNDRESRDLSLKWLGIEAGFKGLIGAMGPWIGESYWIPVMREADIDDNFSLNETLEAVLAYGLRADEVFDEVERAFLEICKIQHSTATVSPYFISLETIIWCRRKRPISPDSFNKLITFVGRMTVAFRSLLLDLDTAALLMLAHWLNLMLSIDQWWIVGRCRSELREMLTFLSQQNRSPEEHRLVSVLLSEPYSGAGLDDQMGR